MVGEFTQHARDVVAQAQNESRAMRHGTVEAEHLLLGLFSDEDGIPGQVFADLGMTVGPARELVRERLETDAESSPEGSIPFSPGAQEIFDLAGRIALAMGESVDTQHMLLAITRRTEGGGYRALLALDVDPGVIRFEVKKRAWPAPDRLARAGAPEVRRVHSAQLRQ